MGGASGAADVRRVRARSLLAVLVGAVSAVALVGAATTASAGRACLSETRAGGYSYAGHQAAHRSHGVRATITLTRIPTVDAGHVAGWVGVGGPGQGANGGDAWIQAGIASVPGTEPFVYAEITREGRAPKLIVVEEGVPVGLSHSLAVLEVSGRPGWWRVWADGRAVTEPVRMRGSSGRWAPIATAESWNAGTPACNAFGFRFERVSVSSGGGASWRPFVSGHRFLDATHTLRDLAAAPAEKGVGVAPYAFVAASAS
jgi:hypothetical protein